MTDLRPLTQEQRQSAQDAARAAILRAVGERPDRDQFDHHTASADPQSMTRLITLVCVVTLVAAFTPSAIRLYVIGSQTFGQTVNSTIASTLVGLATVLIAETGQVVFSLALATLGASRPSRRLLYASMALATSVALVGNIQVALPGHLESPFAWFEAIAPPLLVLSLSYVLKEQMLKTVRTRHANERAYQDALATWVAATADPGRDPRWSQFYANALKDEIRRANARRGDALAAMNTADWRAAVYHEMQADMWYSQPHQVIEEQLITDPLSLPVLVGGNGNGNGHH